MAGVSYERFLPLNIRMEPILYGDILVTFVDYVKVRHPQDWEVTPHRDSWYEFNYIANGSVFTSINGEEFLAQSGSFFLIPPGVVHSHRHHEFEGDEGFCLRFLLEKVLIPEEIPVERIADRFIDGFQNVRAGTFCHPADRLLAEIENLPPDAMKTAFLRWLMDIRNVIAPVPVCGEKECPTVQKTELVNRICIYLADNHCEEFDANALANSMGYSYRHLSRIFKDAMGMTIGEQLNAIRIAKAQDMLRRAELSIQEIGEKVGFNSATYFSTVFLKHVGCSPKEYRKK